ncbi:Protein disulfide-isomerase A5 [Eumeta japonica]|uniref:Protein disulfide-isomerase A5 n=1 Tax=Eumeta variegata TaxID=151549 RepID=A0A4C1ZUV2_EUMVA|nr:Protein disulfide-isomerase A5 [Eumeta japonica]
MSKDYIMSKTVAHGYFSGKWMNGKKLCKRMKIPSDNAYYLKHYKDGQFHKDYTRPETVTSIVSFLKDPTGEIPWEEDPATIDISHLKDQEALTRFLKKGVGATKKALVMFYAPWCGYCKVLKPEFLAAATELRGVASLAALDASKYENSKIRQQYNISGFPTLLYFE